MPSPDSKLRPPEAHPILAAASNGVLPPWAEVGKERLAHMTRVAALLSKWARLRSAPKSEAARWVAVGYLHDALRGKDPARLREEVGPPFQDLPGGVLHGPGAAAQLRRDGVEDEEFLHAIEYHTLGSPAFGTLGMALYAADFLEPGRKFKRDWRKGLRRKAGADLEAVVREVLSARVRHQVEKGRPLHPKTVGFWNRMAEGPVWASASEL